MTCLAGPCEPLGRHLSDVASCVAREGALVARKLARVFAVGPEVALDLLVLTAYLHDVGKADEVYGDEGYFPLHEVRSVAVAYRAFRSAGLVDSCRLVCEGGVGCLCKAVLAAIALHHYSHKRLRRRINGVKFAARCPDDVEGALGPWTPASSLGRSLRDRVVEAVRSEIRSDICFGNVVDTLTRAGPRLRHAVSAVLGTLNRCDIAVAKANRCCRGSSASRRTRLS